MMTLIFQWISRAKTYLEISEQGQDLTEYALLVALIAIIVVVAVLFFGEQVSSFFSLLGDTVSEFLT